MADELQLASALAEVTIRDPSDANVGALAAEVVHRTHDILPLQIATMYAETVHQTHDVFETHVAHVFMEVMRSIADLLLPAFIAQPDSSATFPVDSIKSEGAPVPIPVAKTTTLEANPYRPDVPNHLAQDDPELYEYLREQAELLRQQHNLTQAGDSTFPWEIATLPADKAEFTLGSASRFVHAQSGLFFGRFVQFRSGIKDPLFVGLDKGATEWVATNDPKRTSKWRPLGYTLPAGDLGGRFGWVMTHGRAPFSVTLQASALPPADTALTWDPATPDCLMVGPGPVVARIIDPTPAVQTATNRWVLPASTWVLCLGEGVTPEYIDTRLTVPLADFQAQIDALEVAMEALESQDYAAAIEALDRQQRLMTRQLALEADRRTQTDRNFNRKIESLSEALGQLQTQSSSGVSSAALDGLRTQFENLKVAAGRADQQLGDRISALETWKAETDNLLASLLAAVQSNQRPQFWRVVEAGMGVSQNIILPSNGLLKEQVGVWVNGLKWPAEEYEIVEQNLVITTNAVGDQIEIVGL